MPAFGGAYAVEPAKQSWCPLSLRSKTPLIDATSGYGRDGPASCASPGLVTFRPGYHPPWTGKPYATQVALSRLTPHDSAQVVQALLHTPQMSRALLHEIVTKADGNPFFLEELTRNVAEQETTQPPLALPDTIHAVLTARMDRLAPVAKRVLQTAALIGKEVPFSLLATITRLSPASLSQSLAQLQAAELLHETCLVPESVYAFKHILIQSLDPQRHRADGGILHGAHQAKAFVPQRLDLERRQGLRVVGKPEIGPSRDEPFDDVRREAFDDGQPSLRHLLAKLPDQRHRVKARQCGRQRDRHVANRFVPVGGQIRETLRPTDAYRRPNRAAP